MYTDVLLLVTIYNFSFIYIVTVKNFLFKNINSTVDTSNTSNKTLEGA